MIKTTNLDKYFNKNKPNSIHVINNTSLEFPEKGLVSLVGQSGSGKTTLLNVISGLDKANGTIQFDDIVMDKYSSNKWDKIRTHDIGYVFQNYYLLEDRTVFENIELTLNMIGVVDKEEVTYRCNYVLEAVGMFRFRNKKASDLSGGQKQRVAIARAIAKNPKVVIADEPTGNLDSANSVAVMKIIKKISEERLVVLVTHNMLLANKYSDRIVTLSDGSVLTDLENEHSNSTELEFDDGNIYLGNLNNYSKDEKIKIYSNSEDNDVSFTVVKINNNYYLQTNQDNVRINIVDNKSDVKIIDKKIEDINKDTAFDTSFSLDELDKVKTKRIKKRTLSLKEAVITAFKKITNLGRKSKIQMIALILLGVMFASSVHGLFSSLVFDDSSLLTDKHVYIFESADYQLPLEGEYYSYFNLDSDFLLQIKNYQRNIWFNDVLPYESQDETDITYGRYPENIYEVLVDETFFDKNFSGNVSLISQGILKKEHLVGQKFIYKNQIELEVVGTVKTGSKAVYMSHGLMLVQTPSFSTSINLMLPYDNKVNTLPIEGSLPKYEPLNNNSKNIEVVADGMTSDTIGNTYDINGFTIKIVGVINTSSRYHRATFYMNTDSFKDYTKLKSLDKSIIDRLYTNEPNIITDPNIINLRNYQIGNLKKANDLLAKSTIAQMAIAIAVSGLIFFFLVRSSMTSRVKEISILRSLGVSKYEVVSLFSLEYFILTAFTSLIGVVFGTYMVNAISKSFMGDFISIRITFSSTLVAVIGIFLTNILLALIPVLLLLRKTPASMLTMYDI